MRGLLVGQQKQQVDVGERRQLAAPIAADRDEGKALARRRVGERVDFVDHHVEQRPDQLIHQKALLAHHCGTVAKLLKAAPDLGPAIGEGRPQRSDERRAIEAGRL